MSATILLPAYDVLMRRYRYVGPLEVLAAAPPHPTGAWLGQRHWFDQWIAKRTAVELREPFTYVIDREKCLLLAPRRESETARAGFDARQRRSERA